MISASTNNTNGAQTKTSRGPPIAWEFLEHDRTVKCVDIFVGVALRPVPENCKLPQTTGHVVPQRSATIP